VLSLQLPSLRAMYKYLPAPLHKLIPLCFLLAFFVYAVLFRTQKLFEITKVFLNKKSFFILLFILITLVNILVYPLADSLKYQARGSDQDDALIVGAKNLISGKNPYEAHTYFPGNPLSPGPGWLIMNLPFTTSGLYCLLTPFYISVLGLPMFIFFGLLGNDGSRFRFIRSRGALYGLPLFCLRRFWKK